MYTSITQNTALCRQIVKIAFLKIGALQICAHFFLLLLLQLLYIHLHYRVSGMFRRESHTARCKSSLLLQSELRRPEDLPRTIQLPFVPFTAPFPRQAANHTAEPET